MPLCSLKPSSKASPTEVPPSSLALALTQGDDLVREPLVVGLSPCFPWVLCAQGTGESRGWARALVAAILPLTHGLTCAPVCVQ